jgi:hypothetical protein
MKKSSIHLRQFFFDFFLVELSECEDNNEQMQ